MPRRSAKPCRHPGCPNLIPGGADRAFCDEHQRDVQQAYDAQRGSATERGYGATWRKLRKLVLAERPLCEDPFETHEAAGQVVAAEEVHHLDGNSRNNRPANLQALCKSCHSRVTVQEQGRWG